MTKRFYVATSLARAADADAASENLKARCWEDTYNWRLQASLQVDYTDDMIPAALAVVSANEVRGVSTADVLLALLPAGRGTHTEIGIALGLGKPVVLWMESQDAMKVPDKYYTAFAFHPLVTRAVGVSIDDVIAIMERRYQGARA